LQAKEFLGKRQVAHRSANARDGGEGEALHAELGAPVVPSLVVDGRAYPLLHASQIASILGLPPPEGSLVQTTAVAYDSLSILQSWLELLGGLGFDLMLTPTRSRGRTPRNLTVNVFHPFALLPGAWADGTFQWHTEESDAQQESTLTDAGSVRSYARDCLLRFQGFLLEHEGQLDARDPWVHTSTRGEAPFSIVVHAQRSHAAIHHRQLVDFLQEHGASTRGALDVDGIADLTLPAELY
jgi:hypothetical protein